MYKRKKIIITMIIAIFSIFLIVFGLCIKPNKKTNINNENLIDAVQNEVIEDGTDNENENIIENDIIKDNSVDEEEQEKVKEEITQTEKTTKIEVTEKTTKVEIKQPTVENKNVTSIFDESSFSNGYLNNYPNFGDNYATLKINKIGVNAPIYFGATDENLLKGVAHDSGSYFCGEGGTVIMCEHNYMNNFKRLGELNVGDIVEVKTNYGDFYYKLYDSQIVLETETDKLPIQKDKELLMIYTCYPFSNYKGHTEYRYVIYAEKI